MLLRRRQRAHPERNEGLQPLSLRPRKEACKRFDFNLRYAYRSAQPKSITATGADAATPAARINPDGSVMLRNEGRKDNKYSALDLRLSKSLQIQRFRVQLNLDAYNALNANSVRALSSTFGSGGRASAAWQRPQQILDPRLFQIGGQINF